LYPFSQVSRDQNAGQNGYIQIGNESFETAEQIKYLGKTLTNQNSIREEINACYHSVQNLLSSSLLSKSVKIKIYRTVMLPVVLYGCETWSLTLREECRLRVFENGVLRRIFGPERDEVTGEWRRLHNKELYALYSSPNTYGTYGGDERCIQGFSGETCGSRPLRTQRRR
jgi:hypothetical protein